MSIKIHALHGVKLSSGEPEEDVVLLLKTALAKARKGEIAGIAIALVDGRGSIRTSYASGCADKNLMMAATHGLHTQITKIWYDEFEDLVKHNC